MELVFHCMEGTKRLFEVVRQGHPIFVGSEDECQRFLELHRRKVETERVDDRRPIRHPAPRPRTYRAAVPRAG